MRDSRFWLLALIAFSLAGCVRGVRDARQPEEPVEISDMTESARLWADSVCSSLTLKQKAAQLMLPAIYSSDDEWTMRLVRQYADSCVGGVVLLKGDTKGAKALSDSLSAWSVVSPLVAIDAEWGLAMRLVDAPKFPANGSISPEADDRLMYDYGNELARECRLVGVNMVLGPVVDVSGPDGVMKRRSLGDDPCRVADLSVAYARGLEDGNVISVAKHFPGHGSVHTDSHWQKGVIGRSLHAMDSVDLYPYRRWVEQQLSGIMVGHLAVPSIDPEMRPAAFSHIVINDLLRGDLGFEGLVLTDAINMGGAEGLTSVDAIKAGADIVVAPRNTFAEIEGVVQAVAEGRLTEEEIDNRVRRILFHKYLLGMGSLHDDGSQPGQESRDSLCTPAAREISTRLSQ